MGGRCFPVIRKRLLCKWDGLEPGTLCCNAAKLAPVHTSPWATKYKETVGDKLTLCTQLRQILEQKIQRHFWRSGYKIWVLRMSPLHTILPKGWANQLSHPSSPKALPEFLVWPLANFYWLEKAKNRGWYHKYWIRSYFTVPSVTSVSFLGVTDSKVQLYWNFSWLRDSRSSYTFPTK